MNTEQQQYNPDRSIEEYRSLSAAIAAEKGHVSLKDAKDEPNSEYSLNYLKEEINKVVWMFAAGETPLMEAEKLSFQIFQLFVENRQKHGATGAFQD